MQHRPLVPAVHERHVAKFDLAPRARYRSISAAAFGGLIEQFEDALAGGDALLQGTADINQASQRPGNQHQRSEKSEQLVDPHVVQENLPDGDVQHPRERHRGDGLYHGIADGLGAGQFHLRSAIVFVDRLEAPRLMIFGIEYLD